MDYEYYSYVHYFIIIFHRYLLIVLFIYFISKNVKYIIDI